MKFNSDIEQQQLDKYYFDFYSFVDHTEEGLSPHQVTTSGDSGTSLHSRQPLSQFQWDKCSSLLVTQCCQLLLRGGHISEMCEVIPVFMRHLRKLQG